MTKKIVKMVVDSDDPENMVPWEIRYKKVLDHGFIGLVDIMGDDQAIVDAARVSYGGGTKTTSSPRALIRYLLRKYHTSPVEMGTMKFHIKMPIFVARQWMRHRTGKFSEISGRYSILTDEMYVPHHTQTKAQAANNKQGRDELIMAEDYNAVKTALDHIYTESYQTYKYLCGPNENGDQPPAPDAINARRLKVEEAALASVRDLRRRQEEEPEKFEHIDMTEDFAESVVRDWLIHSETFVVEDEYPGIARELARIVLPLSTYTEMYWKVDMKNLLGFMQLRSDPHAQYEIRVYSDIIMGMAKEWFPDLIEAFEDYWLNSRNFSTMELMVIKAARWGQIDITNDDQVSEVLRVNGASDREVKEFLEDFIT